MKQQKKKMAFPSVWVILLVIVGLVTIYFIQFEKSRKFPIGDVETTNKTKENKISYGKDHVENGYYYSEDLGIKFKISNELQKQGLITRVEANPYNKQVWLSFSTDYLSNATDDCSLTNGALGSLWRGQGKYQQLPSSKLVKQFEDYFIAYNSGGYDCSFNGDDDLKTKHNLAWKDFEDSLRTIEEIRNN